MTSITDAFYNIIGSFFPSALMEIPVFNFLINLFFFAFCCWVFALFFIFPLKAVWKWFKSHLRG